MIKFSYTAKDKFGQTVSGAMDANSEVEIADALHKKELIVISVEQVKEKAANNTGIPIKKATCHFFNRILTTLQTNHKKAKGIKSQKKKAGSFL